MAFFGLFSKKEVAEKEQQARQKGIQQGANAVLHSQQTSLQNLARGSQVEFAIPYFDVFDPRFENYAVPVSVHGMLVYAVEDIERFNNINKTEDINDGMFLQKLKGQVTKYIKEVVTNAPIDNHMQVLQLERNIVGISELAQCLVLPKIEQLFAVNIRSLDITNISIDKDSRGYHELKSVTTDFERENLVTKHRINLRQQEMQISGQEQLQRMHLDNQRETMRIQREELQRAARLETETNFMAAHQANLNAEVAIKTGGRMFGCQSGCMQSMPEAKYMVAVGNEQQIGPCNWQELLQLANEGLLTHDTYVWKQGMDDWKLAGEVQDFQQLFSSI